MHGTAQYLGKSSRKFVVLAYHVCTLAVPGSMQLKHKIQEITDTVLKYIKTI